MSGADLANVRTSELAAELRTRAPRIAHGLLRRARAARVPSRPPPADEVFAVLERPGRKPVPLHSAHRDSLRSRWRLNFWEFAVLFELHVRGRLPADLEPVLLQVAGARTPPFAPGELQPRLLELAGRIPDLRRAEDGSELAFPPSPTQLKATRDYYRRLARELGATLGRHGVELVGSRILEIGTASGTLVYALAELGANAIGVDPVRDASLAAGLTRDAIRPLFRPGRGELLTADAATLPFPDESFDAVISVSTLEHVRDLRSVLAETLRVLRPGGLVRHSVEPWFSQSGGHALGILDFPWGHVRLDEAGFADYVARFRPHEEREALRRYREGFQSPRLTLAETEGLFVSQGYELLGWADNRGPAGGELAALDEDIYAECTASFPGVSVRDLVTATYVVLARKPSSR